MISYYIAVYYIIHALLHAGCPDLSKGAGRGGVRRAGLLAHQCLHHSSLRGREIEGERERERD